MPIVGPTRSRKNASSAEADVPDAQPTSVATYPAAVVVVESAHGDRTGVAEGGGAASGMTRLTPSPSEPPAGAAGSDVSATAMPPSPGTPVIEVSVGSSVTSVEGSAVTGDTDVAV